jgi:predicted PurR-regulated permease PerM
MVWVATLALVVVLVVLLREVLLPFVAGIAFAYLRNPLVSELERFSRSRAAATLMVLGVFFITIVILFFLAIPIIGAEIAALIDNLHSTSSICRPLQPIHTIPGWARSLG